MKAGGTRPATREEQQPLPGRQMREHPSPPPKTCQFERSEESRSLTGPGAQKIPRCARNDSIGAINLSQNARTRAVITYPVGHFRARCSRILQDECQPGRISQSARLL